MGSGGVKGIDILEETGGREDLWDVEQLGEIKSGV